jgi:hypothetical protein
VAAVGGLCGTISTNAPKLLKTDPIDGPITFTPITCALIYDPYPRVNGALRNDAIGIRHLRFCIIAISVPLHKGDSTNVPLLV